MPAVLLSALLAAAPGSDGPDPAANSAPARVAASLAVAPGLTVELAAAEPLLIDPVAVRFDERGRAWVVEMRDYPSPPPGGFTAARPPRGRVRVLEDADGDGRFDAARTFADGLTFPTGVQPWRGGAFVTLAGRVSYFPDDDQDGAADGEEVWFAGFAEQNEQHRASHPVLGPDGLIYVGNGLQGGAIVRGAQHPSRRHASGSGDDDAPLDLSGRTFAFDPHTGAPRVVAGAGQFGLSIDDFGDRFFCENRKPVRHAVLPDDLTALNPDLAVADPVHDVAAWGPHSRLYATQAGFTTSLAHAGQFTAACGAIRFDGDGLGPAHVGDFFVCEPTAGLVHREVPRAVGATFTSSPARAGAEFLTSTEPDFRPVDLAAGPGGSLYVCDMARAVIEHPHWMPEELKNRPDLRDGDELGRLWRVRSAGAPVRFDPATFADPAARPALLDAPNGWTRATAARLLSEARDPAAIGPVRAVAEGGERPAGRARALFLLASWEALTEADALAGLRDPHPRVAGVAARVASDAGLVTPAVRAAMIERLRHAEARPGLGVTAEDTPRLAFDLCVALAPHAGEPGVFDALANAAARSADPYLHAAVLAGAGRGDGPVSLTAALWASDPPAPPGLLERAAEVAGRRGEVAATAGLAVGEASATGGLSPHAAAVLRGLDRAAGDPLRRELAGMESGERDRLAAAFAAGFAAADDRAAAVFLLDLLPGTRPALAALAAGDADAAVRAAAVRRSGRARDETGTDLIRTLPAETPAVREALLDFALTSPARSAALLDLVEAGELTAAAVGPGRARRLSGRGDRLGERARTVLAAGSADRAAVLERYQSCLTVEGDVARGRAVFVRACATCHAVDGAGVTVGADISDTYNRTPESLLTNILDPNRAVDAGGFAYTALTADGRVLTGLLTAETAGSITLTSPGGEAVSLPRSEVLELRAEGASLMPAGLENQVSESQMADLLAFLKGWRYVE